MPTPRVLTQTVPLSKSLLENVLQLCRDVPRSDARLSGRRHYLDHVHLLRAHPKAVTARRAKPQIGIAKKVDTCLGLAVQLAGAVLANDVDRADWDALSAPIAPFEGLATR